MDVQEKTAITEEHLLRKAGSLGELLEQFRDRISPLLIGGQEWERLLERSRELPSTFAAFPFGFELPLHEIRPGADLGISVVGGTRSAGFFEKKWRSADVDPYIASVVRLLNETAVQESPLRQIVGRKMMLEFDIGSTLNGMRPDPGIFLRPVKRPVIGGLGTQAIQDIGVVLDAMAKIAGWDLAAEQRQVQQIYSGLKPGTQIESFGVFPARRKGVRIAVVGFRESRDVVAVLKHAGWRGQHSIVESTVSSFKTRDAFAHMGVHFDVHASGVGPTLGLSFVTQDKNPEEGRYWLDSPKYWTALFDGMRAEGLGIPDKLSEVANWPAEAEVLFDESGSFVLLRGIHHIKLVWNKNRIEKVKAYVFLLMGSWGHDENPAG